MKKKEHYSLFFIILYCSRNSPSNYGIICVNMTFSLLSSVSDRYRTFIGLRTHFGPEAVSNRLCFASRTARGRECRFRCPFATVRVRRVHRIVRFFHFYGWTVCNLLSMVNANVRIFHYHRDRWSGFEVSFAVLVISRTGNQVVGCWCERESIGYHYLISI